MTTRALLDENPDPTEEEIRMAISGAICRCTGYKNIVAAVRWAAEHSGGAAMSAIEDRPIGFGPPEAQGGRALHPRQGQLPGRHPPARHGPHGDPALAVRAREDQLDRHVAPRSRCPGVAAVITAKDLETLGLAWMPTISYDTQAVLAGDKVRFQGQEVAAVIATDEYIARDALQLIEVDYEPLDAVVNARKALDDDAPLIRDDKDGQTDNLASPDVGGGRRGRRPTSAFAEADTIVARDIIYPRCHPAPLETCGMIADFNPETGQLDIYNGNQAPHAHRTVYAHVAGLAEHMIRIRCGDIGGGFGNKVPVYPGYVCAIAGSIVAGVPVKWIEDRSREPDVHRVRPRLHHEVRDLREGRQDHRPARGRDRRPRRVRLDRPADQVPGRLLPHRLRLLRPAGQSHVKVKAVYTNKAPGGVAYRCSFRITEAVYLVERMVDALALEMKVDPIDLRMRSLHRARTSSRTRRPPAGRTTPATTTRRCRSRWTSRATRTCASEQAEKRARGELMGIGVSFFTEGVGAGPRKHMDILGLSMNDGADLRVHPSGKAVVSLSAQTQGQGHETTFAQIVAEELGIPPEDVEVRHGDTDKSPYGLGTYGVALDAGLRRRGRGGVAQGPRQGARDRGARCSRPAPRTSPGRRAAGTSRATREQGASIFDITKRAYSGDALPEGMEGGLDAQVIYDPPNLTYPYGAYIAVVDIDPETAHVKVRRFIAVDDCGVRINPMIVEGQIHGGLAEGIGIALMEVITFDEEGNCLNGSFMDYLIPTALECPDFELGETVTPCPHHPLGAKGVGESPNVGSPPAIVNAVIDALYETPRRRPHRHAVHARPRVGGDAGQRRRRPQ